jgi:hypothetical protein
MDKSVTAAVFHAPMSALNALFRSACDAEPHAVHCRRKGLARFGADAWVPKHARTYGCTRGTYVVQVRIVDTFIYVAILIDIDLCIHHLYKHYVCNIDNYIDSLIERGVYR